jgi:hypothetical protein
LFASAEGRDNANQSVIERQAHAGRNRTFEQAFDHALNLLGVVDRNDPLCDMVARKVIEVGATGISEPREIAEMTVVRIGLR